MLIFTFTKQAKDVNNLLKCSKLSKCQGCRHDVQIVSLNISGNGEVFIYTLDLCQSEQSVIVPEQQVYRCGFQNAFKGKHIDDPQSHEITLFS